jgi:geranylgeranyl pyrophosphate synthase
MKKERKDQIDPERQKQMNRIRNNIKLEFRTYGKSINFIKVVEDYFFEFLKERINCICVRSYFVFAVSEYIQEQIKQDNTSFSKNYSSKLFDTQLPLIGSWIIAIQYLENQILDGKGGIIQKEEFNRARVNQNLIVSHYLKDTLYGYIEDIVFPDHPKEQQLLRSTIRRIFQYVDLAQYWDKTNSSFQHFSNPEKLAIEIQSGADAFIKEMLYSPDDKDILLMDWLLEKVQELGVKNNKKPFFEAYFKRICLENGALFVLMARMVADVLEYNGSARKQVELFAIRYALMSQVVNDNVDSLPSKYKQGTVAKIPEDVSRDLKNDNISFSLAVYLAHNPKKTREDLLTLLNRSEQELFEELRSTVTDFTYPFGTLVAEYAKTYLEKNNPISETLGDMANQAYSQRIYKYFFNPAHEK